MINYDRIISIVQEVHDRVCKPIIGDSWFDSFPFSMGYRQEVLNRVKEYSQTLLGRNTIKRRHAKRRQLSFIPINNPFEGCEGHHVDTHFVIYIPKEMHKSNSHNVWTGQGMNEINTLAIKFLQERVVMDVC